jgi:phosphatidylserine/phosphatidylglycerophosphate/cardiolipin synthase-like enzyme
MASTTNPADWFLPDVASADGNTASPLVDGASYFAELKGAIENVGTNPYLLIAGWRLDGETFIDPANAESFNALITRAASSLALRIRSMLWYFPGTIGNFGAAQGPENAAFTDLVASLGGEAILDNRLPNGRFASHHQKFAVVGSDDGHVAFVGGIDVAPDRWDDQAHNSSPLREPEFFRGWHDVQVKVEGPAVTDIWNVFQERWNDPRRPHNFPATGSSVPTPLADGERPAIPAGAGTHSVQVLKTYACKSNAGDGNQTPYPFAPAGNDSYQRGLVRAINNADHYVYVEDQYFWPSEVVNALADAVRRGVAVILMLSRDYDVDAFVPYHNFLQNEAIEQLTNAEGEDDLVFVFHLEQSLPDPVTEEREQIYVHAKTIIVDDRYFVIGSANSNRRSLTTDSELGVAIVDNSAVNSSIGGAQQSVGALARSYRKALWAEHLGSASPNDPFDANRRPAGFPTGVERVGHVRRHTVGEVRFCHLNIVPFGLMNSKTTCDG